MSQKPEEWLNIGARCNELHWNLCRLRAGLQQKRAFATAATQISISRSCSDSSIDILIQPFFSTIERIPTARERDSRTATPGKLAVRRYLCLCHGSSCCACQGGISVNMLPQSSIIVGIHMQGGEPVISDTGQRCKPNSWCWVWGMQKVQ